MPKRKKTKIVATLGPATSTKEILKKMIELTGKRTVPQIFIEDHYIGGFDDLRKADTSGELDKILSAK